MAIEINLEGPTDNDDLRQFRTKLRKVAFLENQKLKKKFEKETLEVQKKTVKNN
jgi:hypothetical protein